MAELKTCPFCGSQHVDLVIDSYHGWPSYERTYKIICFSCSAQLYGRNKEELIAAWNRRADANSLTEVLKRNTTEIVEKANGIYIEYIRHLQENNKALNEELASLRNEADAWNRRAGEDG